MIFLRSIGRPWHPDSPLPIWMFIALTVLVVAAGFRLVTEPMSPDSPVDFRPIYMGQLMLVAGENPYDDNILKDTWKDVARREGFETRQLPGYPRTLLMYPPWALPLFTVFSQSSWMAARALWWGVIPLFILGIAWCVSRGSPARRGFVPFIDVLLLVLAFKATDWAVYVGQPMFLCLLLGFASWHLERTNRPILSGITLGLASFKVTLVLPFVLLMSYRRKLGVLAVAALTGAALLSAFLILNPDPAAAVASYRDNIDALRTLVFSPSNEGYPIAFKMVSRTEIAIMAEFFVPGAGRFDRYINLIPLLLLLPLWVRPLARGQVSAARAFSLFAVVSLICTHHLHYDCLVLLPLYLLAIEVDGLEKFALLAVGSFFLVPINGLLGLVSLPPSLNFLLFNVQIGLVGLAAVLTWGLRRRLDGTISME